MSPDSSFALGLQIVSRVPIAEAVDTIVRGVDENRAQLAQVAEIVRGSVR